MKKVTLRGRFSDDSKSLFDAITRSVFAMVVGAVVGSIFGAVSMYLEYYSRERSPWLLGNDALAAISAFLGATIGWAPGVCVGLFVGIIKPNSLVGTVIGGLVGLLTMIVLILTFRDELLHVAILSVPACAFIGFTTSFVARWLNDSDSS